MGPLGRLRGGSFPGPRAASRLVPIDDAERQEPHAFVRAPEQRYDSRDHRRSEARVFVQRQRNRQPFRQLKDYPAAYWAASSAFVSIPLKRRATTISLPT